MCGTSGAGPVARGLSQAGRCRAASVSTHDEKLVYDDETLLPALLTNRDQSAAGDTAIPFEQQNVASVSRDVARLILPCRICVPGQAPGRLVVECSSLLEDAIEVGPDCATNGCRHIEPLLRLPRIVLDIVK